MGQNVQNFNPEAWNASVEKELLPLNPEFLGLVAGGDVGSGLIQIPK